MYQHKAFTAIELMMVVCVVAIVIAFTASDEDNGGKEQVRLAAEKIEADIAYARNASVARPDDPLVVKFDQVNNRYWLARSSSINTPMTHPLTGKPYLVGFGKAGNTGMDDVQLLAHNAGADDMLAFKSTGSTDQTASAVLQLSADGATAEVSIASTSGKTVVTESYSVDLGFGTGTQSGTKIIPTKEPLEAGL